MPWQVVPAGEGIPSFGQQCSLAAADGGHHGGNSKILSAPKVKLAPQVYSVASANSGEAYKNESAKSDVLEMHRPVAALPVSSQPQEATSASSTRSDSKVSTVPPEPADSFDSRWHGLQQAEASLAFNARWALDSK